MDTKNTPNTILRARGICFSYGERQVLHDIDFDVHRGEIVGLLGPNGTGKTTLMSVLCGDSTPSSGSVELFDKPIGHYTRRELARTRGVMPQSSEFPFAYTARDVVAMGRYPWDTSAEEDARIVNESLECADVTALADRDVTRVSGGEASRITFARVLAGQGQIVFLDEPTAALDIAHQERTMQGCRDLSARGVSVVALMHDIQLAAAYCDRIALMSGGRIVACGSPSEVLTGELLTQVYGWEICVWQIPETGEIVVLPKRGTQKKDAYMGA